MLHDKLKMKYLVPQKTKNDICYLSLFNYDKMFFFGGGGGGRLYKRNQLNSLLIKMSLFIKIQLG